MKYLQSIFISFCLIICLQSARCQNDTYTQKLSSFAKNITNFNRLYPQEKAYLHFDNTGYFLGETIWFKAYIVTAKLNSLSNLSKVLYVELLTPEGNILETKKLKIINGQCHGDFQLTGKLYSGYYEVRAYTRYMLNFGEECIFSRVFPLFDKPKKDEGYTAKTMKGRPTSQYIHNERVKISEPNAINLSFYPEGGQLVNGLRSYVAFKATDRYGRGISLNGFIVDNHGREVAAINTSYNGMGIFNLLSDSVSFKAHVSYEGKEYEFNLPKGVLEGYTLEVNNRQSSNLVFTIQKSDNLPAEEIGLCITCRGELQYFETIRVTESEGFQVEVPKQILTSGVNQVTLFNVAGKMLAERLFFILQPQTLSIKSEFDKSSYNPHELVNFSLDVTNNQGKQIETTMSVSVRDGDTETSNNSNFNILTNLLLSSDLKGYIENPAFYFESSDRNHQEAMNLLMMTQGWKRYSWKQISGIEKPSFNNPIEPGLLVDGTTTTILTKKPKENVLVKMGLTSSDSIFQEGAIKTDKEGKFCFVLQDFKGIGDLTLQTIEKDKRKEMCVTINRDFSPVPRAFTFFETNTWKDTLTIVKKREIPDEIVPFFKKTETKVEGIADLPNVDSGIKPQILSEIEVKGKKTYDPQDEGLEFATIVYNVENETDKMYDKGENFSGRLLDFLTLKCPYFVYPTTMYSKKDDLITNKKETDSYVSDNCIYKSGKIVFVINNNTIIDDYQNRELLDLLTTDQIESIMISEDPLLWHKYCGSLKSVLPHAVFFIYTNKDGIPRSAPMGVRKTKIQGYSFVKEFFQQDYKDGKLPNEIDFRRTLYWNPEVKTDKAGKAIMQFYNNSSCKKIIISAEAVTRDGEIITLNESR